MLDKNINGRWISVYHRFIGSGSLWRLCIEVLRPNEQTAVAGAWSCGYAGVVALLIMSFQHNNVLYVNGMWDGVSGLIESLAAYYILGDRFEKKSQYLGLGMIVVGVALMKDGFPTWF